jgi:DNA-binding response OmpR family regulator
VPQKGVQSYLMGNMKKYKILIVEDENSLQTSLREFLSMENFEAISAFNGEEGIKMAQEENPDLILLDIILPKKNGFEVLEFIRKNKKTEKIPVILLTNMESAEDVNRAFDLGVTTYLVKSSYTLEDIVKKIKETLDIG